MGPAGRSDAADRPADRPRPEFDGDDGVSPYPELMSNVESNEDVDELIRDAVRNSLDQTYQGPDGVDEELQPRDSRSVLEGSYERLGDDPDQGGDPAPGTTHLAPR